MAQRIREVTTPNPTALPATTTVADAARTMPFEVVAAGQAEHASDVRDRVDSGARR